jgi:hypothetical protein
VVHEIGEDTRVGFFVDDLLRDTSVEVGVGLELEDNVQNIYKQQDLIEGINEGLESVRSCRHLPH